MKIRIYPLALPVLLALAACGPAAGVYTEAEAPKLVRVDTAATQLGLAFAAGSSRLARGEEGRLQRLALNGSISPEDRVTISVSGDPLLRQQRIATISSELLRFGIVAAASPLAGVPRDRAIVAVNRSMVTLPACPNRSRAPREDFTNALPSDFGCATASNLALMVASPADLVGGRELGLADGRVAAATIQNYVSHAISTPGTFNDARSSAIALSR